MKSHASEWPVLIRPRVAGFEVTGDTVIVASNIGVDEAFQGCDEAAGKLINQYFRK